MLETCLPVPCRAADPARASYSLGAFLSALRVPRSARLIKSYAPLSWPANQFPAPLRRHMTSSDLVAVIDSERQHGNLSSAMRNVDSKFVRPDSIVARYCSPSAPRRLLQHNRHACEVPACRRCRINIGLDVLAASNSGHDPGCVKTLTFFWHVEFPSQISEIRKPPALTTSVVKVQQRRKFSGPTADIDGTQQSACPQPGQALPC